MTGQTKEALIAVGRRMLALDFVAFACLFCSIAHQVIEPWAATIQSSACEPWVVAKQRQRHQTLAQEYLDTLFWSRGFLRVLTLLRQHTPTQELVALARAAFFAAPATFFHSARGLTTCFGRRLPLYMLSLPNFIADATPFFNGTELQVTVPGEYATYVLGSTLYLQFPGWSRAGVSSSWAASRNQDLGRWRYAEEKTSALHELLGGQCVGRHSTPTGHTVLSPQSTLVHATKDFKR